METITNWDRLIGVQTRDGGFYSRDDVTFVYQGANPDTCRHRVIEANVDYGEQVVYECSSCGSLLPAKFFDGRVWKFLPEFNRWEQVGPTSRPSLREQAKRRRELNRLRDSRVERPQARADSKD